MSSSWSPAFAAAVHAALVRRCPPASEDAELAELSQALVEALERGELDLPLTPDRCRGSSQRLAGRRRFTVAPAG